MKKSFLLLFLLFAGHSFARDVSSIYPFPKASWNKAGQFRITSSTKIVTADSVTPAELRAVAALQLAIQRIEGYAPPMVSAASYSGTGGIVIGEYTKFSFLTDRLKSVSPNGEVTPPSQGYVLDITQNEILVAGSDNDGTFNAITTLVQQFEPAGSSITIFGAHVWDYPDYPDRWVFSTHNLLVASQLAQVEAIIDTMSLYKLNGLQQNDFKYSILQIMGSDYFQNTDTLKSHLSRENIEMIPGVIGLGWSSGILFNDPNLAEGVAATATYIIDSDTGRLIPDPRTIIANGDFESITNNQFTGWNGGGSFYDGPNVSAFVDHNVFHGGSTSARCTNFVQGNAGGNCRFAKLVNCDSNKYYSMSAWVKTQALQGGYVQMLALGGVSGQSLTFTQLAVDPTMDWTRVEVDFNTLSNTSVRLYIGVWGGSSGTIWFDDFSIHEAGLSSVLRRAGCPLSVENKNTGHVYIEGVDYSKVVDPWVDSHKDSYFPYHTPPTFKRILNGSIKNGDIILIHYYHPFASISDNSGNGSVMACVSEDTLYKILGDQVTRVNNLYHPAKFFMGHDEIRNLNHDKICLDRHKSPADLLSENMTKCHDLIKSTYKDAEVLMWSDMVDSLHNAGNNYYLVNGDLTGDWNNIPKDITIVNWNGGNAKTSLKFFEKNGFSQISSPYYDVGNTSTIRSWRIAQEGITNIKGMMYTTWASDYNFLRPFAYYAWGAGPNIIHTPLDTSVLNMVSFGVSATVISDPFDKSDAITSVKINILDSNSNLLNTFPLTKQSGNTFMTTVPNLYQQGFRYNITAINSQGIIRTLPTYIISKSQTSSTVSSSYQNLPLSISNYPNPTSSESMIDFQISRSSQVSLGLFDLLGNQVITLINNHLESGSHSIKLDAKNIPSGNYILKLKTSDEVVTHPLQILR